MTIKANSKLVTMGIIAGTFLVSVGIGFLLTRPQDPTIKTTFELLDTSKAMYPQKVVSVLSEPVSITKLYNEDKLVGIVTDPAKLSDLFNRVYKEEYEAEFPDSQLGYVQDVYTVTEMSYNVYEDRDSEIFDYIYDSNLIAIQVDRISFSNGAIIYVKNKDDFVNARREFIKGYISEDAYNKLVNNQKIPTLTGYGVQDVGFEVKENIVISKGLANIGDILLNETQILNFLSFGYEPDIKQYTIKEFDTIDGIAWLNEMSVNQLLSINKDVIKEENQVLKPGVDVNIAKFNSPLTVQVTQERLVSEKLYPDSTIYREDPSLREGLTRVEVKEETGSADVLYEDVYQNDVSLSSTRKSSKVTKEAVRGVVYVGTYVEPKVGSGDFRWPMNNARLTCGWYCYGGHAAADFQSRSNRGYGPIVAIDRGTVVVNTYHRELGNYIVINHNNGFTSLYAHMESRGYFNVGSTVRKGEQIGYVGMTGRTTGPHIHLQMTYNGSTVNPCKYLGC